MLLKRPSVSVLKPMKANRSKQRCMLLITTFMCTMTMSFLKTSRRVTPQTPRTGTGPLGCLEFGSYWYPLSPAVLIPGVQRNSQKATTPWTWLWVTLMHACVRNAVKFTLNFKFGFRKNMATQTSWSTRWWSASLNTNGQHLASTSSLRISSSTSSSCHSWQHLVLWCSALWKQHVSTSHICSVGIVTVIIFLHILQVLKFWMDLSMGQYQRTVKVRQSWK